MKSHKIIRFPFNLLWIRFDPRREFGVNFYFLGISIGLLLFSVNIRFPYLYSHRTTLYVVLLCLVIVAVIGYFPYHQASPKSYTFVASNGETFQDLKLVKEWQGKGNAKLSFALNGMPFLVDYESSSGTQVASSFEMCLEKTTDIQGITIVVNNSRYPYFPCCTYGAGESGHWVVAESAKFECNISSSGCNWRVRVGTFSNEG